MTLQELTNEHHQKGVAMMMGNPSSDALLIALRHMMCAWILDEATPEQLLEIVDKYKRSPFN